MKKYLCMVDFKGRDRSWCCAREVYADSELHALQKLYINLHETMKCAFHVWSIVEVENEEK